MKVVIIQGDGMSDLLIRPDGRATPLEEASTPHFDRIAGCGCIGMVQTIPRGLFPGSDVGNLSLFGYDPCKYYTGRSPLEAIAMGVKLGERDVAFRMNLVMLNGNGPSQTMADYSGDHIDSESAAELVKAIAEALGDESFQFYPGVSYRHLLVWRNGQEGMTTTPPHDILDQPIQPHLPRGEGSAPLLRIMTASREILADHPVNRDREREGRRPISQGWLWGQGKALRLPAFADLHGLKGAAISAVDLVRGVAAGAGFDIVMVPGATGFLDTDYAAKGEYALRALRDHDLVFIHVEAPDEAGHMGDRAEKIKAIEAIDELIAGPLLRKLPEIAPFKIMVVSDHATPISLRTHCADPVPFSMATGEQLAAGGASLNYGEDNAQQTGLVIEPGHEVIARLLAWPDH